MPFPFFVDCEPLSWGLDPGLLEKAIADLDSKKIRPKAIVLVHSYGMPAQINEIREISTRYEIPILEDAAESLGSTYHDKPACTFGRVAVLSFNGNKVLTTGGGGALILPDRTSYDLALKWATQSKEDVPYYHHKELGYNYRISNVSAAIGCGQFSRLNERITNKKKIFGSYKELLNRPGITFFEDAPQCTSNNWLSIVLIDGSIVGKTNLEVCNALNDRNVESRPVWQPLHQQPLYEKFDSYLSGTAERLFSVGLCLPSGSALKSEQLDDVIIMFKGITD